LGDHADDGDPDYGHGEVGMMNTPVTIRMATPADLDRLVELHRQFCEVDEHAFSEERARAAFGPLLNNERWGIVWMIDDPGSYAVLTWSWSIEIGGFEAVLDEIFVSTRSAGVGSSLLDCLVADARQRGVKRIFLETERDNSRARAFYARHGFVEDDSIWMSSELEHRSSLI
jgi:GNAT superfamily N-acetyltransferase